MPSMTKWTRSFTHFEKESVIQPITHSDWVAPVVSVVNVMTHSVCAVITITVNKIAKFDRYQLPLIDDLYASPSGGRTFT